MTPMLTNSSIYACQQGEVVQVERCGYMRVDQAHSSTNKMRIVLIPDGKKDFMSTPSTKFKHQ